MGQSNELEESTQLKTKMKGICLLGLLLLSAYFVHVEGHGRLILPAARNCMWRFGFHNPKNYNDNELFCGGRLHMWRKNHGRCGVCGDPATPKFNHMPTVDDIQTVSS